MTRHLYDRKDKSSIENLLGDLVTTARKAGAESAEALFSCRESTTARVRLGKLESIQRAEDCAFDLRVLLDGRQAIVVSTDFSPLGFKDLAERAVAMARSVPEDPHIGFASSAQLCREWTGIENNDKTIVSSESLQEKAKIAEDAGLNVKGVKNSEGSEAYQAHGCLCLVSSNGFSGHHESSRYGLSIALVAQDIHGMERDYDDDSCVFLDDLEGPDVIGRRAGQRAVKRLGAHKPISTVAPVIFEPRVARTLISHFASAINGAAIARGTSFLREHMGKSIFSRGIAIIDDPLFRRGTRSRPFDGEGLPVKRQDIVSDGILKSWVLDLRCARYLQLNPTGQAGRSLGAPPQPTISNFYLKAGTRTPEAMIADTQRGFYVTELLGMGFNIVTGDYSRGASGFWIDKGEISKPIHEVTIAGNLKDLFQDLEPACDLTIRHGIDSPSVRVAAMTIAGV